MYFEDFEVGQIFNLEPITMTLEDIYEFAKKYDPLPIHIDPDFAEDGVFNGIIASGFHTLCAIWGEWVRLNKTGAEVIGGLGIDYLTWTAPVRPNDSLTGIVEIVDLIPSSKGGKGILVMKVTVYNQDEKIVLTTQVKGLSKGRAYEPPKNQ
jgi:acyl dehydratase